MFTFLIKINPLNHEIVFNKIFHLFDREQHKWYNNTPLHDKVTIKKERVLSRGSTNFKYAFSLF